MRSSRWMLGHKRPRRVARGGFDHLNITNSSVAATILWVWFQRRWGSLGHDAKGPACTFSLLPALRNENSLLRRCSMLLLQSDERQLWKCICFEHLRTFTKERHIVGFLSFPVLTGRVAISWCVRDSPGLYSAVLDFFYGKRLLC